MDDYLDSRNVVSRILLPLMKYARRRRVEVCLRALEGLIELEPNWDKRLKYGDFVVQYGGLNRTERVEVERCLAQSTSREVTMGLFQEARDEAKREGIQQGRREALQEGLLEAIQLGLEIKFGVAGLALMPAIQQIQDPDLMRKIKEALRTAASPEEIRRLYREQPTGH